MTALLAQSLLLLAAFLAVLLALRFLLWQALRWLGLAYSHGPALVSRSIGLMRGQVIAEHLARRFPRASAFVGRRMDPKAFTGLPLTLLSIVALYLVFLLGGLAEEVFESEEIRAADIRIVSWFAPWRTDALVAIFRWITELGSIPTLTAAAFVASAFLLAHGPKRYFAPLWLTVIGSQATTYFGKFIVARPRPEFILDVTAQTPSFPSGHTAGAVAVYGIIAYAVLRDVTSARAQV